MDTAVRPTAPPIAEPATPKRRWPWVVGTAAIALAVGIGATIAWIANVEPLGPGSVMYGPASVRISVPQPAPSVTGFDVNALGVTGGVIEIPARPEMRFTYLVSIRNDGPVAIRIMDVGQGVPPAQVTRRIVAFDPDRGTSASTAFVPFSPFTLAPGEEAGLRMEVRVQGFCMTRRGYASWSSEPVSFRVLGFFAFSRHTDVNTGTEIRIVGDGHTDCWKRV